jgi:hypothetical protein
MVEKWHRDAVAYPGFFLGGVITGFFRGGGGGGGVKKIQLRTEGREDRDLGSGTPVVRGFTQLATERNPF